MQKHYAVAIAVLMLLGVFLAACGANDGSTTGNTPAPGAAESANQPALEQPAEQPEVRWTPSTDAAPAAAAYPELAASVRPSLVFLYSAEPHIMPDGSEMI